jgi:K+-transporting ATPase ATPase C chain
MLAQLRPAIVSFILFTILTGEIYPLFVTVIAQRAFHPQAEGSLIVSSNGKILGSTLIGQPFDDPRYFWGRISAASPAYNASASSGSNLGPSNPALLDEVKGRIKALKEADPNNNNPIPVDLVTSSASGLDPHISVAAAMYQINRVARVRNMPLAEVKSIVDHCTQGRLFGIIGETVVNVLAVNLALDQFKKS